MGRGSEISLLRGISALRVVLPYSAQEAAAQLAELQDAAAQEAVPSWPRSRKPTPSSPAPRRRSPSWPSSTKPTPSSRSPRRRSPSSPGSRRRWRWLCSPSWRNRSDGRRCRPGPTKSFRAAFGIRRSPAGQVGVVVGGRALDVHFADAQRRPGGRRLRGEHEGALDLVGRPARVLGQQLRRGAGDDRGRRTTCPTSTCSRERSHARDAPAASSSDDGTGPVR